MLAPYRVRRSNLEAGFLPLTTLFELLFTDRAAMFNVICIVAKSSSGAAMSLRAHSCSNAVSSFRLSRVETSSSSSSTRSRSAVTSSIRCREVTSSSPVLGDGLVNSEWVDAAALVEEKRFSGSARLITCSSARSDAGEPSSFNVIQVFNLSLGSSKCCCKICIRFGCSP